MFCSKSRFVIIASALCLWTLSEAVPPKTWDSIFNAEGEGDYTSVKIEGNIRLGKYTHYKEVQPVSFKVNDGKFAFSVSGNMTVPAEKIEKENFYNKCNMSKEAWVSYFNKPMTFGKEEQIVNIAGVDLVCGDDTYAVGDLRIKFTNPKAQEYWAANLEGREKYKRERLAEFRKAEQQHHADIRSVSSAFTDPRDGQVYRTIKVEGREWFAQNVNYNVEGHSWCYEDKDNYCLRSGRLYDLEGARKACPEGWHLPRDREWMDMLVGLTKCYEGVDKCGKFAEKMKATTGWHGGGGTDEYGFSVYSSGYRKVLGKTMVRYEEMGEYAGFWSAQNGKNETIWLWSMGRMSDQMVRQLVPNNAKNNAYSVRCINGN
ncbi:fibrobacter succinogenes major paralogous domain-containing protein [uncultured Fibrobacter sp.]|uniref:fibrobacter succinogenes major paralogous domain-containing protein n=1 Tax=uncultured Fibrobacter sp. TaxID=261512 RepID=UPI0015674DB2|nr:fibrobacter succinogenes major paralogous domain-containing protein [uncultured Fibrobacter sp.]